MSCQKCGEQQEGGTSAYYRWKNANVEMRGCDEHLREIFSVLSDAQDIKAKKGVVICPRKGEQNTHFLVGEEVCPECGASVKD